MNLATMTVDSIYGATILELQAWVARHWTCVHQCWRFWFVHKQATGRAVAHSHLKPCIYSKMAGHESSKCIKRSPAWSILTKSSKIDVCSSFLHEGEMAFPQGATLFANPYLIVTFVKFWLWRKLRWALCRLSEVVQGLNLSQFVVIFNDALYFVCQ